MLSIVLVGLWKFSSIQAQAYSTSTLHFTTTFGNNIFIPNNQYCLLNELDSIKIETFKMYISSIELYDVNKMVWKEENSFHLLDAANSSTLNIFLKIPSQIKYNQIKFNVGVDSLTNVSGAMGGDLDPTKGMYWTWQSGYINVKIEGKSNVCNTKGNQFQLHLGGYQAPFNSLQQVVLSTIGAENIQVSFNLKKFLNEINLSENNQIMSPGNKAVSISKSMVQNFSIQSQ
jgi:hypothetical protein